MARIISAEDDPLFGEAIQTVLRRAGHVVGVIPNGALALETIRCKRPDLAILDRALPGMPGTEVLRGIRRDPAVHLMPVLMLTGFRRTQDEEEALAMGASDYLAKPFEPAELARRVETLLMLGDLRRHAD